MNQLSRPSADRNLLFGILALQMDFISRDQLVAAMNSWVLDKAKPLGQILVDQGALAGNRQTLLESLVEEHLKQHGGDPIHSLATLPPAQAIRDELRQIADPDLNASLLHVASTLTGVVPLPTNRDHSLGTTASSESRFRIVREHAKGGLGEVFVAVDEELRREVALKEIKAQYADDVESRSRFIREAEITGNLEHPGVVPVYGLGKYVDGRPFYAMRLIRGHSLQEAIADFRAKYKEDPDSTERSLELRQLLGRFIAVCNAVGFAHSRRVLHRDLKPSNIMLGDFGETLVVDWGIAKVIEPHEGTADTEEALLATAASGDLDLTQMGKAMGTPAFMSPEQAAGRIHEVGPASDIYSLGATLYCLLTGKPPFMGTDVAIVLAKVQLGEFPAPRKKNRRLPKQLEAICLKAMALRPKDRYESARGLADDLEHWLADEPVSAMRESLWEKSKRLCRHRPVLAVVVGVLATIDLAVLGALAFQTNWTMVPLMVFYVAVALFLGIGFVAQWTWLLGVVVGALVGLCLPARWGKPKVRVKRCAETGGKLGIKVGVVLFFAGMWVVAYFGREGPLPSSHSFFEAWVLIALPLVLTVFGVLIDVYFGLTMRRGQGNLVRRVFRGASVGTILAGIAALGLFIANLIISITTSQNMLIGQNANRTFSTVSGQLENRPGSAVLGVPPVGGALTPSGIDAPHRIENLEKLVRKTPDDIGLANNLIHQYRAEGNKDRDAGNLAPALTWYEKALTTLEAVCLKEPQNPKNWEALRTVHKDRAAILARMNRHAEAVAEWEAALQSEFWSEAKDLRLQRALALNRAGEHDKARAEADALTQGGNLPLAAHVDLARVFAGLSAWANKEGPQGPGWPKAQRVLQTEQFAARATQLLVQAKTAGYFTTPKQLDMLKTDADLKALLSREDFLKGFPELKGPAAK